MPAVATLLNADSIQAKAGTGGGAVNYALIAGDEITTTAGVEANAFKILTNGQLTTSVASLYSPGSASKSAVLGAVLVTNTTAAPVGVTFYINGSTGGFQGPTITLPAFGFAIWHGGGMAIYGADGILLTTIGGAAGGDLTGSYPNPSINADAVTNAKLANMATASIKGRVTAATGDPEDLTGTQVTTLLDPATSTLKGLMTAAQWQALNYIDGRTTAGATKRVFRPGEYAAGNTYDPTGAANSTSSFSAMMTAIIAFADRAIIELPPGVFKIDPAILQGWSNASCDITGPGRGVCVLIPSATGDFIKLPAGLTGGDEFDIRGFTIYNTSGTPFTTGAGINVNGCDGVTITDVGFIDLFYDININGSAIKVSIQKTTHFQTNGSGTSVGIIVSNGAAGDTYIGPDVVMSNGGNTRRRACVEVIESGHYEITQCNLTGSQNGIMLDPGAGQIVGFGFHTNVLCDSNTINGMRVDAVTATSTIKNIKSVNSWYSGTTVINASAAAAGVLTTGNAAGTINGFTFSNDRFLNNRTHGFEHTKGTDFRWVDCDMKGNSSIGSAQADGLNVAAAVSNWSINGGKFGGSDTVVGPTGTNQRYGINVAAGAGDFIKISPDDLSGNVTGPLSMGATGNNVFVTGCPGMAPNYSRGANSAAISTVITLGNILIPKNSVRVGTSFRLRARGIHTGAGVPTFTCRIGATNDAVGSAATNGVIVSAPDAAGAANGWINVEFDLVVTAIGGAGNIQGSGNGTTTTALAGTARAFGTGLAARASGAGLLALDTTADRYLTLALVVTTSTITIFNTSIEVVNY